ncbi:hypothetical protein [Streptomyces sp. CBMA29]|uniref:hypothetical protein n=1 Tax=Streptomyces sp. CBMA29 TaxID=1896314 RepID=UPI001661EB00|nr:hypothetical protein [Streptomyces sp. CBMA29]MBD0734024.1 hypothetical protein [Streptomyces sp. CBMA29]
MSESRFKWRCSACTAWLTQGGLDSPERAAGFPTAHAARHHAELLGWWVNGSLAFCRPCQLRARQCAWVDRHVMSLTHPSGGPQGWAEAVVCPLCHAWVMWQALDQGA